MVKCLSIQLKCAKLIERSTMFLLALASFGNALLLGKPGRTWNNAGWASHLRLATERTDTN